MRNLKSKQKVQEGQNFSDDFQFDFDEGDLQTLLIVAASLGIILGLYIIYYKRLKQPKGSMGNSNDIYASIKIQDLNIQDADYCNKYKLLKSIEFYKSNQYGTIHRDEFNIFSLIPQNDKDRNKFQEIFEKMDRENLGPESLRLAKEQSRAIAVMLGMAICDALGASTEFQPYEKSGLKLIKNDFKDIEQAIKNGKLKSRHGMIGIWTDDASMGLAMAYSLMLKNFVFDPVHTRYMFHCWLEHGLGNGGRPHSIGLGGNISISMEQFAKNMNEPYTQPGYKDNNGNGSLMRLAPIPVAFYKHPKQSAQASQMQSLTTHNGLQAKQCSRLMTQIIIALINRNSQQNWKDLLQYVCDSFKSQVKSVEQLAKGKKETQQIFQQSQREYPNFYRWNKNLNDRNWNWRERDFTYSPTRTDQYSGYAGSYCMDGLAMALHVVFFTKSFKECAVKCADMGGDCDTVGSIAGQIAGAAYGIDSQMLELYRQMPDFIQKRYEAFLVGYKLATRGEIPQPRLRQQKQQFEKNYEKYAQKDIQQKKTLWTRFWQFLVPKFIMRFIK